MSGSTMSRRSGGGRSDPRHSDPHDPEARRLEARRAQGRRLAVRSGLLAAYLALMALLFVHGKGHTILLDNKDAEDGSCRAFEDVTVSVDGGEEDQMARNDRDKAQVRGQSHRVVITVTGGQKIEKWIRVPLNRDMLLLSIPKLAAGIEPAIVPFVPLDVAPPSDEGEGNKNSFTAPGGSPPPGAPAAPESPGSSETPGAPATPGP